MLTNHDIRSVHRAAVVASVDVVNTVTPNDLHRATPCDGWNLSHLLAHMTVQHRGFTAAARGDGADPARWDIATVAAAVATDPAGTYAAAAADVLEALTQDDVLAPSFALPEFGLAAAFPRPPGLRFTSSITSSTAGMGGPSMTVHAAADVISAVPRFSQSPTASSEPPGPVCTGHRGRRRRR
jgi:hypothetical protein